jgi:hypothetical protein
MTERTLAASPNLENSQRRRSGTSEDISSLSIRVGYRMKSDRSNLKILMCLILICQPDSSTIVPLIHSQQIDNGLWSPTSDWVQSWKGKLPLQTIMRLLQVLVPQVEKICMDRGLTDESEIIKFLQHGTLVGLLPVPHPILIRKYQPNSGTVMWFRTYMWGVAYLR